MPPVLFVQAICLTCLGLLRHYGLGFGGSGTEVIDRQLVGHIAFGGMILISVPLLIALVAGEIAIEKSFLVSRVIRYLPGVVAHCTMHTALQKRFGYGWVRAAVRLASLCMVIGAFILHFY